MAADFSSVVCFADVAAVGSREARFSEDPFVNLNPALENPLHIDAVRRCESKAEGGLPAGSPASPGGPSFVQQPAAVAAPCPSLGESGSLSSLRWGSVLPLPFLPLLFFHPDF